MAISVLLKEKAKSIEGVAQWPYRAVAEALEVIPRTLIQNAGRSPVRVLTDLRAKHAEGHHSWGIDGDQGTIADMKEYKVWEPEAIKLQSLKTAVEVCFTFLSRFALFWTVPRAPFAHLVIILYLGTQLDGRMLTNGRPRVSF